MRRFAILFLLAGPLLAQEEKLVFQDWYAVLINGAKSGYMRISRKTAGDCIQTELYSDTRMKRFGQETRIVQESLHVEKADGTPIRFVERRLLSAVETVHEGAIEGGKLKLKIRSAGKEREKTIDWDPRWLFPAAQERQILREAGEPGKETVFGNYQVDLGGPVQSTVRAVAREKIRAGKEDIDTVKYQVTVDRMKGVVTTEWRDAEARLVKSHVNLMGIEMVFERCPAADAVIGEGKVPEIFVQTLIRPKQKIGDPRKMTEALYRISLSDGRIEEKAFAFPGQTIEKRDEGSILLRVRHPQPARSVRRPVEDAALREMLQPNEYLQCDDAVVQAVAKEAVGEETDAWSAAKRIERWVYKQVGKKNLGTAFATAKEVCERKEGDCTEHSVLAAGMARAAGIPARVAMGLVCVGENFGGHMWVEVWVGEWVPIDPALGGEFVDATHIKMAESSLNQGGFAEFVNVLLYLGRMRLDVLEYEENGRKIQPE